MWISSAVCFDGARNRCRDAPARVVVVFTEHSRAVHKHTSRRACCVSTWQQPDMCGDVGVAMTPSLRRRSACAAFITRAHI